MSENGKTSEQIAIEGMENLVHETYRGLLDLLPSWISSRMSAPKGIRHFSKQFISIIQLYVETKLKETKE